MASHQTLCFGVSCPWSLETGVLAWAKQVAAFKNIITFTMNSTMLGLADLRASDLITFDNGDDLGLGQHLGENSLFLRRRTFNYVVCRIFISRWIEHLCKRHYITMMFARIM